jgi:hypothetical protein
VLALVNEWYKIASCSIGVDSAEPGVLEDLLAQTGFEQVTTKTVSIPVGEWPKDPGMITVCKKKKKKEKKITCIH